MRKSIIALATAALGLTALPTLAADNGVRLFFQSQEIWKLGKEERLAEQTADTAAPEETRQVATLRLQLQLHITTGKRQRTEKKEKPGRREKPSARPQPHPRATRPAQGVSQPPPPRTVAPTHLI